MDEEEILNQWGYPHLIKIFKDSEISLEAFPSLDYYGIADIVKKQSDRALFWKRFRAEYIDQADNSTNCETGNSEPALQNYTIESLENVSLVCINRNGGQWSTSAKKYLTRI